MQVFRTRESVCRHPSICLQAKLEMLTKSTTCEIPDPYGYPEETYARNNMKKMCDDQGLCQWFMNTRMCEGRNDQFVRDARPRPTVEIPVCSFRHKVHCALMQNTIHRNPIRLNVGSSVLNQKTGMTTRRKFMK